MPTQLTPARTFDLQERTFLYAKRVRSLLKSLSPTELNSEDKKQLLRSSGSVAANYIEANEALGTKDFAMRMKISRKEAKESVLWLRLMKGDSKTEHHAGIDGLIQEGMELVLIFSSIIKKFK